jgi:hypothetical protein
MVSDPLPANEHRRSARSGTIADSNHRPQSRVASGEIESFLPPSSFRNDMIEASRTEDLKSSDAIDVSHVYPSSNNNFIIEASQKDHPDTSIVYPTSIRNHIVVASRVHGTGSSLQPVTVESQHSDLGQTPVDVRAASDVADETESRHANSTALLGVKWHGNAVRDTAVEGSAPPTPSTRNEDDVNASFREAIVGAQPSTERYNYTSEDDVSSTGSADAPAEDDEQTREDPIGIANTSEELADAFNTVDPSSRLPDPTVDQSRRVPMSQDEASANTEEFSLSQYQRYPEPPTVPTHLGTSSSFSVSTNPDEDMSKISDLAERRRVQNRIAQRNYRKKLKKRLEDLVSHCETMARTARKHMLIGI